MTTCSRRCMGVGGFTIRTDVQAVGSWTVIGGADWGRLPDDGDSICTHWTQQALWRPSVVYWRPLTSILDREGPTERPSVVHCTADVTLKCLPHEKSARGEIITELIPLFKYRRPHKMSPHYRIASPEVFPGRQCTGKNPPRPSGRRAGRIFTGTLSAGGRLFWRSYNRYQRASVGADRALDPH